MIAQAVGRVGLVLALLIGGGSAVTVTGCTPRQVQDVDPRKIEAAANLIGAILYDAAGIAYGRGAIDIERAKQIDEAIARFEGLAHTGNVQIAQIMLQQVLSLIPARDVRQAEAGRGEKIDDAAKEGGIR